MPRRPWLDVANSGYLMRSHERFPKQGDRAPWLNPQDHEAMAALLATGPEDGVLQYGR